MTSILEALRNKGCHFLTYGMIPASQLGEIIGINKFTAWIARCTFKIIKWIFKLNQRKLYWKKFHPKTEPSYLLFSKSHLGWQEIRSILNALKIKISP